MPEVADRCRRDGREDLERCGPDLRPRHRRALEELLAGRTEALGGPLLPCDHGGQDHDGYHSCRHRRGPTCHPHEPEAWRAERRQDLLPVPSFPLVFTGPHAWGESIRQQQQALDGLVLRAAAQALIQLAADPPDVGGLLGGLGGWHPWPRPLASHPPVHGLVPAAGVSADRTEWRPARTSSWVPVHAVSTLVRGRCRDLVRQERPDLTSPEVVWTTGGVVSCTPAVPGTEQVRQDLGRDVHRRALTTSRMLSSEDGHRRCRSQEAQDPRWQPMTLPALECIRRCLPHGLPQG
jgi:hypothetical protein